MIAGKHDVPSSFLLLWYVHFGRNVAEGSEMRRGEKEHVDSSGPSCSLDYSMKNGSIVVDASGKSKRHGTYQLLLLFV